MTKACYSKQKSSLAPYSNYLYERLLSGSKNEIAIIFMGHLAEERAASFQSHLPYTMYLPYPTSPLRYAWPLRNTQIYLCDTGHANYAFIKHCVTVFFAHGATFAHYISTKVQYEFNKDIKDER